MLQREILLGENFLLKVETLGEFHSFPFFFQFNWIEAAAYSQFPVCLGRINKVLSLLPISNIVSVFYFSEDNRSCKHLFVWGWFSKILFSVSFWVDSGKIFKNECFFRWPFVSVASINDLSWNCGLFYLITRFHCCIWLEKISKLFLMYRWKLGHLISGSLWFWRYCLYKRYVGLGLWLIGKNASPIMLNMKEIQFTRRLSLSKLMLRGIIVKMVLILS